MPDHVIVCRCCGCEKGHTDDCPIKRIGELEALLDARAKGRREGRDYAVYCLKEQLSDLEREADKLRTSAIKYAGQRDGLTADVERLRKQFKGANIMLKDAEEEVARLREALSTSHHACCNGDRSAAVGAPGVSCGCRKTMGGEWDDLAAEVERLREALDKYRNPDGQDFVGSSVAMMGQMNALVESFRRGKLVGDCGSMLTQAWDIHARLREAMPSADWYDDMALTMESLNLVSGAERQNIAAGLSALAERRRAQDA